MKKIKDFDDKVIDRINKEINNWEKIIISDKMRYVGELKNKQPNDIAILFEEKNNEKYIEYIGYFKKGKFEGYGRKYNLGYFEYLEYFGFFKDNKLNGIGIFYDNRSIQYIGYFNRDIYNDYGKEYKYGRMIYQGYFNEGKHQGKGTLYYDNETICFNGYFKNNIFINGVSYDPDGNKIYEGEFIDEKPKEGKNLKIYKLNGKIIYKGDFLDGQYSGYGSLFEESYKLYEGQFIMGKYNGYGILYRYDYQIKEKVKLYEGYFLKGYYNGYGILYGQVIYNQSFIKLYEGQFKGGNFHGLGKKYIYNNLGYYLYYDGNYNNNNFDREGILFYKNGLKFYKGNFNNNKIEGKGIKYYQNGSKKYEGIFNTLNDFEGKYYDPENKEIYSGKIKNGIPIDSMDIILYGDNTYKIYEGGINNGVYEGYGIEYCPFVKDMIIYNGYFSNNYFIDNNDFNELISKSNPKLNILLLSKGDQPGKSTLISKITNTEYIDCTTKSLDKFLLKYEYNEKNYKINIFDSPTSERFINISLINIKISDIIIYTIDLDQKSLIKEDFIDRIIEEKSDVVIYVVGNKLDKIEEKDITKLCLENIRNQASELIKENKIHKYFETSGLTGE